MSKKTFSFNIILQPEFSSNALVLIQEALRITNQYRINEAKTLLKQSPSLYMTEVSDLSGFGSVNSFLRIFKLLENCTPTEYKKKYC